MLGRNHGRRVGRLLLLSPPAATSWPPGWVLHTPSWPPLLSHGTLILPASVDPEMKEANRTLVWGHLPDGRGRPSSSSCEGKKGRLLNRYVVGQISPAALRSLLFREVVLVPLCAPHPQTAVEFRGLFAVSADNLSTRCAVCRPGHPETAALPTVSSPFQICTFEVVLPHSSTQTGGQLLSSTLRICMSACFLAYSCPNPPFTASLGKSMTSSPTELWTCHVETEASLKSSQL